MRTGTCAIFDAMEVGYIAAMVLPLKIITDSLDSKVRGGKVTATYACQLHVLYSHTFVS